MTTNTAPSFMTNIPLTSGLGYFNEAYQVAVQADGKIVVDGYIDTGKINSSVNGTYLERYNSNGTVDTSFGVQGFKQASSLSFYTLDPIALQTDGKTLMLAIDLGIYTTTLERYNSDGSLDTAFGTQGKVHIPDSKTIVYDNNSGKILIANEAFGGVYTLSRYNSNGSLDTTFGSHGKVTASLQGYGISNTEGSVLVQSDGKIILAGGNGLLVRYNSNGSIDTSFGNNGTAADTTHPFSSAVLQADGKVLAVSADGHSLFRFNANGSLDTAFGSGAKVSIADTVNTVIAEADGKLLAAGHDTLTRYNNDGSLDNSFGGHGTVSLGFIGHNATVEADGKILVTGTGPTYSLSQGSAFYLARYNSDGTVDTSFTHAVDSVVANIGTREHSTSIIAAHAHISDATLDALNGGAGNYNGATLTLARDGGANADDVFGASGTLALNNGVLTLGGTAVGAYQQNGGQLTLTFAAATSQQVNSVLDQLNYTNNSKAAPASVKVDWTFSDGNATHPLSTTSSTSFTIRPVDDGHSGNAIINGNLAVGQTLTASNNLTDPDNGVGKVSYQWYNIDNYLGSFLGSGAKLVLTQAMLDTPIMLLASYTDGQGFLTSTITYQGTAGNDRFAIDGTMYTGLVDGDFSDLVDGGNGSDTVTYYSSIYGPVSVNLGLTTAQSTVMGAYGIHTDTLLNIENVYGNLSYSNTLTGNAAANTLFGGDANDTLSGGGGNDNLLGGGGNDLLDGGAGVDTAYYFNARTGVTVNLALTAAQNTVGAGTDTLLNIENLSGSWYNDTLTGTAGNNALYGLGGNDTLSGGAGNDALDGGLGNDTLTGGAGKDLFIFSSALGTNNIDTITDFNVADDTIRLSKAIFTTLTTPGVLAAAAFKILGNGNIEDNTDHILYNTATGALSYDADGSGTGAAVQIAILGKGLAMTNAYFIVA